MPQLEVHTPSHLTVLFICLAQECVLVTKRIMSSRTYVQSPGKQLFSARGESHGITHVSVSDH